MQHHASADPAYPLYDARWEHDACGTGFIVQISGERSHALVEMALEALARLTHRGAQDADAETGDGAGVLTQLPTELFRAELAAQGITPPEAHALAVGMLFLPPRTHSPQELESSRQIIEQTLAELEIPLLLWRQPPLDVSVLGSQARATLPTISQILLACPDKLTPEEFEASLYYARRLIERRWLEAGLANAYVASLSRHTLVYKGLMAPDTLARFYLDLANPLYTSAFAIFHQRYSTNTFPSWPLAQPFRMLAHNGEINTLLGNRNWMRAREKALTAARWGEKLANLLPVIQEGGSDSAQLDNVLEFLTCSGRDLLHSMQMLVPPAWEQMPELDTAWRAWCEYHAGQIEPWDGPAALVFSDGRFVGAALDRNGLRPARYTLTSNGLLILASEVGVISCEPHEVVEKGRLGPGQMIAVDLERHAVLRDEDIKTLLAQRQPYEQWIDANLVRLTRLSQVVASELCSNGGDQQEPDAEALFQRQLLFGVTNEDVELILRAMVQNAKEPIWSMGDDTPLASLSLRSRSLADYFHQRFAQVTNPPIDPLREQVVMSLDCYLGRRESLLSESPRHAHLIHLETPLLTEAQLETLRHLEEQGFRARTLEATFALTEGPAGLETALARLEREAVAAVQEGIDLLILSDLGTDLEHAPVPMLLAVGAVHQELIRRGLRTSVSLICETGAAWDIHQIALLLGYGAEAIVPAVALATVRALAGERHLESVTPEEAVERYFHGVEEGLRKVMARMGISTVRNIIGGGQFEIVALEPALVERCFAGSPAHPGRIGLEQIARQLIEHHQKLAQPAEQPVTASRAAAGAGAAHQRRKLPEAGYYRYRRDAEYHAFNPLVVRALQKVAQSGDPEDYRRFTELIYGRPPTNIRDLLSFVPRQPIPIEEVEPVETIRARFVVSAMSLGALSPEAHRTIAAAMNSIGGRNNTGEGGEDPDWYYELLEGHPVSSKIKQVASARFGVTTEYLVRAEELEIKMAQGSKPGEGGQLPPNKVTPFIARLRHTAPGVPLISPPPHHDIYSIEDLAQLIYDLRQVNPRARIGVKLVSSKGVGTIAAGVAKAHANYIHIAGHDGGTGASPFQSIKHAGIPWELGLAETQQTLVRNGLRSRVRVRVDGGLKTGRDVVIAAMLGADEFGFGTAVMVSLGCDMARQCHLNTCPAGIATQREDLRAKYTGRPEMVVNYLTLLAQEVREILAQLGVRRLDEIIGRADLLQCPEEVSIELAPILATPAGGFVAPAPPPPGSQVAAQILSEVEQALNGERSVFTQHSIQNADRTVGASLAGEIAHRYGNKGLPGVSVTCTFHGSAGQSFGAFCVPGMRLILNGEANDYVGKGMTGGQIVIMPPPSARYPAHKNIIMGNAVLYGATGGQLFAAGCAGERFAVRNSGALAVVEGVGAHACEYMTGGMVVVLGSTGINFGAGMSAGVAYVLDTEGAFPPRCNTELVELQRINDPDEAEALRKLIVLHRKKTHSWRAAQILAEWDHMQRFFWRVAPRERMQTACDFLGAYPEEKRDAVGS
ncbi:glutamate synthase large subunit [Thermogemmatispora onikobensis]|uniref:glutamate synthase large subunit n=1 Tax=Thermogemmatispora onikobensis TaxID=732234 RepID=UPI000853B7CE|nr:glutamate synthase large subunit [Thermogemmatispora onikobensis]